MKKTKFIMKAKRLLSGFVATAIAASMLPTLPAMAEETTEKYPYTLFAGSSEEGAITVNAGNFCVNGNVATNGTIVSSGNMNINGTKTENAGEETIYILKKLNYVYFSGDNVDVYPDDYSYEEINININDPMAVQGELELTGNINLNTGIKALEDVNLNGEVKNTNDSLICSETGDIVIDSTNVNLNGLVYAPHGDVEITAQNLNLNNVIIIADTITFNCPSVNANYNISMAELVGTESDVNFELYAFGEYNLEANSIDIKWYTNYSNSSYEIWTSADNTSYTSVATVTDSTEYQYAIDEDFDTKYFKISLTTNYNEYIESIPFIVRKKENGYFVDFLDSEDDGLPDVFEISLGTDINDADSDKDGLSDFQEFYITGTEPTIYDSVVAGVPDADADSDNDALSNIQEIELGTNPQLDDSDDDDISDYNELYVYETNPINPDSDNDRLEDGDELHIGLDPTNPETFGTPDAEYKVEQTIPADSGVLSEINIAENAYELSVELKTNGFAEKEVTVSKSGYSYAIENDAMIGLSADICISDTCNPEEIVLKYSIKESYIDNTLNLYSSLEEFQGIKRLNIFKFHEDTNMLLPIETDFDVENGLLYAEVDELGTYCIMDMEIWLNNLGVEMPEESQSEENVLYFNSPSILSDAENSVSVWSPTYENVPIDLIFILQSAGKSSEHFDTEKQLIIDFASSIMREYSDVKTTVVEFKKDNASILTDNFGREYFTNIQTLSTSLNNIEYSYESDYCDRGQAFKILLNDVSLNYEHDIYVYKLINGNTNSYGSYDNENIISKVKNNEVRAYSEIMPYGWHYRDASAQERISKAITDNKDLFITLNSDTLSAMSTHFPTKLSPARPVYEIIIPTKWKKILLDGELNPDNNIDTDGDTLTDWEEVDTERLIWNEDESFEIPTFNIAELVNHLTRFQNSDYNFLYNELMNNVPRHYLPILSDPTDIDSDDDGLDDDIELVFETTLMNADTDSDNLNDGYEVELWYDPINPNPDGDSYNDSDELKNNTSPYVYTLNAKESVDAFAKGMVLGEFDEAENFETLAGQITGSFIPFYADGRDYFANIIVHQSTGDAIVNLFFCLVDCTPIGVAADVTKVSTKIGKFFIKFSDDAPKVIEAIIRATKLFPDDDLVPALAKAIPASSLDDVVDSIKSGDKITKAEYNNLKSIFEVKGENIDELIGLPLKYSDAITSKITRMAGKFKNLECVECADELMEYLKSIGQNGKRLNLTYGNSYIIHNLYSTTEAISHNGKHSAILFNNKVYDNLFPSGIDYNKWINGFEALGEKTIETIDF